MTLGSFLAPSFGDWPQWETSGWAITNLREYRSTSPVTCGLWDKKQTLPAGAIVRSFTASRSDSDMSMMGTVIKHYYPDGRWFSTEAKRKSYDASGDMTAMGQSSVCRVESGGDPRQGLEDLDPDAVAAMPTAGGNGVGMPMALIAAGVAAALFFWMRK